MINGKTYYQVLGVLEDAEDAVIRASYKVLAQKYHPDKWTGAQDEATKRMSEINVAHATLSDCDLRRHYDRTLKRQSSADGQQTEWAGKGFESTSCPSDEFDLKRAGGATQKEPVSKSRLREGFWYVLADMQKTTQKEREQIKSGWVTGLSLFVLAMLLGLLLDCC